MAKILFIQPHPDDLELNCAQLLHYFAVQSPKHHEIRIIAVTLGEFGLPGPQYDKFKGDLLAKIRWGELQNALALHKLSSEIITRLYYIDGYVPFSRSFIEKFTEYLQHERPVLIVAPEPLYTDYPHMDHINAGRAIFYILHHQLIPNYRPSILFYQTLAPNFFLPFSRTDIDLLDNLLKCHKTQFWLLNWMKPMALIRAWFNGWQWQKYPGQFAEGFRRFTLNTQKRSQNQPSWWVKIWTRFYWSLPFYQAKYPVSPSKIPPNA